MDKEGLQQEEGSLSTLEETEGQPPRADGRSSKLSRFIKVQLYLSLKDVVLVDEQKLKFMKQGTDISRSRLVSEAIRLLAKEVAEGKFELKG
ncbi:MAG: hypothetical protein KGJ84_08190 [Elusimicrobia bacterium]|nr:hypothetical protein [Elusimicrobiota bacterium]